MTSSPPDAAVQIAADVLSFHALADDQLPHDVVAALAREGWLHDPAEVAALRAVADAADELFWAVKSNDEPQSPRLVVALHEAQKALTALDALPPAGGAR